jgi:hypothetical protein
MNHEDRNPAPLPPDGEPDTAGIEAAKRAVYESMPVVLKDLVARSEGEAAIGVPHGAGVSHRWIADVAVRAYLAAASRAAATPDTRSKIHGTGNVPAPDRWLALDRRSGRVAGLPTVEVVAAEDYDREVNDLRDQVQMYEEKAERDWRDFGEMQDARIAADDRVVELEKELARVCKQLDSANDMVERARSLAHRSRCEGYDEAPAASPDERLREALALIAQHARLDLTERGIAEAERYAVIAEDALAAADREAPDEETKR